MPATPITARTAQVGDIFITGYGDTTFEVIDATDEKIALGDPSALAHKYAASRKWYRRDSKILARWTVTRPEGR